MNSELLIVCKFGLYIDEVKEHLYAKLNQVLEDNLYDIDELIIETLIRINYIQECETIVIEPEEIKRVILGISLDIPEEVEEVGKVIDEFCSIITENGIVEHVVKFEDENLLIKNRKLFDELFYLEMKLRRVITMIYLFQYSDGYLNLLKDEVTKPTAKELLSSDQMGKAFENEFFHLLFSQYVNLNSRKLPTKIDEFIGLIKDNNTYEDFSNELNRTPIIRIEDRDFLAGLKDKLDSIEKVRNCVAHNRKISLRLSGDYENAKKLLEAEMDNYLNNYKY